MTATTDIPKGRISIERTAWCGNCDCWHQESAPSIWPFLKLIRDLGWVSNKQYGWLCPGCAKKTT